MGITCTCLAYNIANYSLKLNFEKSRPTIFLNFQYRVIDCVSEGYVKGVQVMATSYQPAEGSDTLSKSRTLRLKSVFKTQISFQNTKSVLKTRNQFSKHKISSQNTKSVLKTQNQFSKHKISSQNTKSGSQIINT